MNIDIKTFIKMLIGGEQALFFEQEHINDLNVFPVPDGDTGSNMYTTVKGAISCIENLEFSNFNELGNSLSKGMLMNARGNSGVILSQIIRGFVSNFNDSNELTVNDLKQSFELACQHAYKSVPNPVEGTILTVIRIISEKIKDKQYETINDLFSDVVSVGQEALDSTPKLLKELEEVGVVDSGGYGLLTLLKGMNAILRNDIENLITKIKSFNNTNKDNAYNSNNFVFFSDKKDQGFGYCTEIILDLNLKINPFYNDKKINFNLDKFIEKLSNIGDSIVCTQFDNLVKVHIHTMEPFKLFQLAQKYGEFERVKAENMTLQYNAKITNNIINNQHFDKTKLENGTSIIMTAPTKKIAEILKQDFMVDDVIITEDSGNPSMANFLDAVYKQYKNQSFIITDDSNIIMAADEAKKYSSEITIDVIPAKNVFEAISCVAVFDKKKSLKMNSYEMKKQLRKTASAVISTSIKNVSYKNIEVKKNNKIGIINKKIVVASNDEFIVIKSTLDKLISNKKFDICYLICGKNANMDVVKQFEEYANDKYGLYCEVKLGEQKTYDYYLGLQ